MPRDTRCALGAIWRWPRCALVCRFPVSNITSAQIPSLTPFPSPENHVPQERRFLAVYNYSIDVRMLFVFRETEGITYPTGVGHDEREALAVDDMPVERVDLGFGRSPSGARLEYA
jgi:hypothetical protein